MARRCLEVSKLVIQFPVLKKKITIEHVIRKFKAYLEQHVSNAVISEEHTYGDFGMTETDFQFQESIPVNTVNDILSDISNDTNYWYQTIYNGSNNKMTVKVLE